MNQPFDNFPDMLTIDDFAKAVRIGKSLAYRMVRSGQIRSRRFGRTYRIPKSALIAFVNDGGASS